LAGLAEIELKVVERDGEWFVAQVKDGIEIMGPFRYGRADAETWIIEHGPGSRPDTGVLLEQSQDQVGEASTGVTASTPKGDPRLGHVIMTALGFESYDGHKNLLGTFKTKPEADAAIHEHRTGPDRINSGPDRINPGSDRTHLSGLNSECMNSEYKKDPVLRTGPSGLTQPTPNSTPNRSGLQQPDQKQYADLALGVKVLLGKDEPGLTRQLLKRVGGDFAAASKAVKAAAKSIDPRAYLAAIASGKVFEAYIDPSVADGPDTNAAGEQYVFRVGHGSPLDLTRKEYDWLKKTYPNIDNFDAELIRLHPVAAQAVSKGQSWFSAIEQRLARINKERVAEKNAMHKANSGVRDARGVLYPKPPGSW
jgi:hypothetical protein